MFNYLYYGNTIKVSGDTMFWTIFSRGFWPGRPSSKTREKILLPQINTIVKINKPCLNFKLKLVNVVPLP